MFFWPPHQSWCNYHFLYLVSDFLPGKSGTTIDTWTTSHPRTDGLKDGFKFKLWWPFMDPSRFSFPPLQQNGEKPKCQKVCVFHEEEKDGGPFYPGTQTTQWCPKAVVSTSLELNWEGILDARADTQEKKGSSSAHATVRNVISPAKRWWKGFFLWASFSAHECFIGRLFQSIRWIWWDWMQEMVAAG